jgi:hypothetical protein
MAAVASLIPPKGTQKEQRVRKSAMQDGSVSGGFQEPHGQKQDEQQGGDDMAKSQEIAGREGRVEGAEL